MSIDSLRKLKADNAKFSVVAAYDASFARQICKAGVDVILIGDSLGMTVQGHNTTLPVTIDDMAYHTHAVARGNHEALLIADMPFMTYHSVDTALTNAARLVRAGANMVKLEGGRWLAEIIARLVEQGIPVCAHLGLTPQSVNKLGGFKVQGRNPHSQSVIKEDAKILDAAGASFVVLECIPSDLAGEITEETGLSTIGIGAGNKTDAQVLVAYDILGMSDNPPRFVHNFLADGHSIEAAFSAYNKAVKDGSFPAEKHQYNN